MKYLFISTFLILSSLSGAAQKYSDKIIRTSGDIIMCTITLVNDQNIFFTCKPNRVIVETHISLADVMEYTKGNKTVNLDNVAKIDEVLSSYNGPQWLYCELLASTIISSVTKKYHFKFNAGTKRGEYGEKLNEIEYYTTTFGSLADGLNYYGRRGWELIATNLILTPGLLNEHKTFQFIMKRQRIDSRRLDMPVQ